MFTTMMEGIKEESVTSLFNLQVQVQQNPIVEEAAEDGAVPPPAVGAADPPAAAGGAARPGGTRPAARARPRPRTTARAFFRPPSPAAWPGRSRPASSATARPPRTRPGRRRTRRPTLTRRSTPTWAGTRPARAARAGSSSNATATLVIAESGWERGDIAPQADSSAVHCHRSVAGSARSSRSASTRTRPPKPTTAVISRTSAAGAEVMTRRSRGRRLDASNGPSSRIRCSGLLGRPRRELTGGPGARQGLRQHLGELARPAVRSGDSPAHAAALGWLARLARVRSAVVRSLVLGLAVSVRPRIRRPVVWGRIRRPVVWGQGVGDLDLAHGHGVGQRRLTSVWPPKCRYDQGRQDGYHDWPGWRVGWVRG